ncbi:unnamed protein product, partial [Mycena citricolor]
MRSLSVSGLDSLQIWNAVVTWAKLGKFVGDPSKLSREHTQTASLPSRSGARASPSSWKQWAGERSGNDEIQIWNGRKGKAQKKALP